MQHSPGPPYPGNLYRLHRGVGKECGVAVAAPCSEFHLEHRDLIRRSTTDHLINYRVERTNPVSSN